MIPLTPAEHAEVLRQMPGPIYLTVEGDRMGSTLPHVKYQGSEYGEGWFAAPSRFAKATGPCPTCDGTGSGFRETDSEDYDFCPSCEGTGRKRAELRAEAEAGKWPQCDYPNGVLFAHATIEVLPVVDHDAGGDVDDEHEPPIVCIERGRAWLHHDYEAATPLPSDPLPRPGHDWIVVLTNVEVQK